MEENKIWANLNDSYNLDVILIENENIKQYIPKKNPIKYESDNIKIENNINMEDIINNILIDDYKNLNKLQILEKQNLVSSFLIKYFRNLKSEEIIWSKFKPYLNWILETSKFILDKTSLKIQSFKVDKIYRSSYKFCVKKDECENFYGLLINKKINRSCKCLGDHYVHYKIISDLTCLFEVLDNNENELINNLRICLDTINYVIHHMYLELNNFNIYYSKQENFNINKYYIVPQKKYGFNS